MLSSHRYLSACGAQPRGPPHSRDREPRWVTGSGGSGRTHVCSMGWGAPSRVGGVSAGVKLKAPFWSSSRATHIRRRAASWPDAARKTLRSVRKTFSVRLEGRIARTRRPYYLLSATKTYAEAGLSSFPLADCFHQVSVSSLSSFLLALASPRREYKYK